MDEAMEHYRKQAEEIGETRWCGYEDEQPREWEPWPHPCSKAALPEGSRLRTRGPIGLLIQTVMELDQSLATACKKEILAVENKDDSLVLPFEIKEGDCSWFYRVTVRL